MKHLGTRKLETKRLLLRKFNETDTQELYSGYINQKEFLYYANKMSKSFKEVKQKLINMNEKYKDNDFYNWAITLKDNFAIIGTINLKVNTYNNSVEFNYAIDNRYINKGYMTEALNKIKEFAFNELLVTRFQGGCCVENIASEKVMKKCGLKYEGTLKKYIKLSDGYHDMYMYASIN